MDHILQVSDLKAYFYTEIGIIKAVDGVNFNIERGSIFGIVGESGSGKTLTALSILRLLPFPGRVSGGRVIFNGSDLLNVSEDYLRKIRGSKISFVFQDPSSSFNPVFTIGEQITEAVLVHQGIDKEEAEKKAFEYLKKARISDPKTVFYDYPHQLSGGTKQRAMIAMALVNSPELVILDEPTTALDVTVQSQVLNMLKEIIEDSHLSVLFISHDFGVVSRMCDSVAVMHNGRIIESGPVKEVLQRPKESYTASLLDSVRELSCR